MSMAVMTTESSPAGKTYRMSKLNKLNKLELQFK